MRNSVDVIFWVHSAEKFAAYIQRTAYGAEQGHKEGDRGGGELTSKGGGYAGCKLCFIG